MKTKLIKIDKSIGDNTSYYIHIKYNNEVSNHIELKYKANVTCFFENKLGKSYFFGDKIEGNISNINKYIKANKLDVKEVQRNINGRFILIHIKSNSFIICSDKLGRTDLFYSKERNGCAFSTCIEDLNNTKVYDDQLSLLNFYMLYGSRAPRSKTLFSKVSRLGVCDILKVDTKLTVVNNSVQLRKYKNHNQKKYNELFLEALEKRGNKDLNVVCLSSGWDSTSILAGLSYIYGKNKVVAVTSRATHAKRTGIHNNFEVKRATKIAKAVGCKHYIVNTDFSKLEIKDIEHWVKFTKKYGLYGSTAMAQYQLAEYISNKFGHGTTSFSGENSDGMHNLGFSQYASIFHKYSRDFREYYDKMRFYLYGPSFLQSISENYANNDPVFKIIKMFTGENNFNNIVKNRKSIVKEMLTSCFLYSNRIPYFKGKTNSALTDTGIKKFFTQMYNQYLKQFENTYDFNNPHNTYLNIYPSFHWQSSNVACFELAGSENGIYAKLPFQDYELMSFVASAPESWGKGLDLNPVKYPLKRFLSEKMKFPMEIGLGPHSYIYDIRPNFSILGEYIYGSNLTKHFKGILKNKEILNVFNDSYFNKTKLNNLLNGYLNGKEIYGEGLNNLSKLVELALHYPNR